MGAKKGKGNSGNALARMLRILKMLPYPPEGLTVAQICNNLRTEFSRDYGDLSDGTLTRAVQRDLAGLRLTETELDELSHPPLESASDSDSDSKTINPEISRVLLEFDVALKYCKKTGKWSQVGLKPLPLSNTIPTEQKLILAMSDRFLQQFLPKKFSFGMSSIFERALKSNAPRTGEVEKYLASVALIAPGVTRYPPDDLELLPENLGLMAEALFQQLQVQFSYTKSQSTDVDIYRIHPIGLVQRGYRYIFVGIKHDKFDSYLKARREGKSIQQLQKEYIRQFFADRFASKIDILIDEQKCKNLPSLQEVLDAGVLNFNTEDYSPERRKLILRFSKNKIGERFEFQFKEQPISLDQQIYINNGFKELTATVIESIELQWMLQGMASGVKVIEGSDTLKDKIKQFAQAAYELQYGE